MFTSSCRIAATTVEHRYTATSATALHSPDAIATPYIMLGATDSRFFTAICPRVYRFTPFRMTREQRASLHSFDEHLGVDALVDGVRWYRRLLEGLPA